MIDTTSKTRVLTVRGVRYTARLWNDNGDGWNYVVRGGNGIIICTGFSVGTMDDAVQEAMSHLRQSLMGL